MSVDDSAPVAQLDRAMPVTGQRHVAQRVKFLDSVLCPLLLPQIRHTEVTENNWHELW